MKLLIICERLDSYGGLETHVVSQVNELTKRGYKVTLYTNAINDYHSEIITYDKLICPWSLNCFDDIGDYVPDVVISHPFSAMDRACDIANKYDKRFIVIMHGIYDFGFDNSPFGYKIGNRVDRVIAVDNVVYEVLRKSFNCPKDKLYVNYNGIDIDRFKILPFNQDLFNSLRFNLDYKTIGIVSRLQDSKDIPIRQFLNLLPVFEDNRIGLNILICGEGKFIQEIRDLARQVSSDNININVCGNVNNIEEYFNIADYMLCSAKTAMEAISCGKTVLQMGIGSFGDVIKFSNYDNTLFDVVCYREYSNIELYDKIIELLNTPFDKDLNKLIRKHCNLDVITSRLERLIKGEL
jgi:glycosyltransferase involved in cell wall biosynthesis